MPGMMSLTRITRSGERFTDTVPWSELCQPRRQIGARTDHVDDARRVRPRDGVER